MLNGIGENTSEDFLGYYLAKDRTDEEKREAILEMIRIAQSRLGGLLPRYAPKDGKLLGEDIKGDSLVYMHFVSANQDENAFENPGKFNPRRSKNSGRLEPRRDFRTQKLTQREKFGL